MFCRQRALRFLALFIAITERARDVLVHRSDRDDLDALVASEFQHLAVPGRNKQVEPLSRTAAAPPTRSPIP